MKLYYRAGPIYTGQELSPPDAKMLALIKENASKRLVESIERIRKKLDVYSRSLQRANTRLIQ